jgi:hypothetical protein
MPNKIFGITGTIGSGKDTAAEHLINKHNFTKLSFASSLKDAVSAIFGWDRTLLEGDTPQSRQWREQVDPWWAARLRMPHLTPRWVLQFWGTEVCRNGFHKDIWVASLENKLRNTQGNIVITDCRFLNELDIIRNVGGTLIRIERGEQPSWIETATRYNKGIIDTPPVGIHASEYSSVGYDYDHVLSNNSTKQDLFYMLDSIVNLQVATPPSNFLTLNDLNAV